MIEYKGSELWKNIEYTNDIDQLSNMSKYIDGAVLYHETIKDEDNLQFFRKAQEHWISKVMIKVRIRKHENTPSI
jgi:hypothetical protein